MSQRPSPIVALAVLALVLVGCTGITAPSRSSVPPGANATPVVSPTGTLFRTTMLTGQYQSVPLVLGDATGLVTAVAQAQPGAFDPATKVAADPNSAKALLLTWLGGACETEIDVAFATATQGYSLEIQSHRGSGTCPAVGIPRALRLTLSAPISAKVVAASGD